ncbi:hypothetical protein D9M73_191940 [compost metagenome]
MAAQYPTTRRGCAACVDDQAHFVAGRGKPGPGCGDFRQRRVFRRNHWHLSRYLVQRFGLAEGTDLGRCTAGVAAVFDCGLSQVEGLVDAAGGDGSQTGSRWPPYASRTADHCRGYPVALAVGDLPAAVSVVRQHPADLRATAVGRRRGGDHRGGAVALVRAGAHADANRLAGDPG